MSNPQNWKVGTSYNVKNEATLEQIKEAGLDCIELVLHGKGWDTGFEQLSTQFAAVVKEAERVGLEIWSVHLPYGHDWDVSCPDPIKREQIITSLSSILQLADGWGAGRAILHPSYEPIPAEERQERLALCRDGLHELAQRSNGLNVKIAVECLPRTCLGNTSEEILYLIEPTPELIVCCDVNHLLLETAPEFINKVGPRIGTVHMSDYDGIDERHWMPGKGVTDWKSVIRSLADQGYEGPFLFEVRNPSPSELKRCWEQLLALEH